MLIDGAKFAARMIEEFGYHLELFACCSEYFVFDILGDLCFGECFELKEPAANQYKFVPHFMAAYLTHFVTDLITNYYYYQDEVEFIVNVLFGAMV